MTRSLPVYVVAAPGGPADAWVAEFGEDTQRLATVAEARTMADRPPGIVLLDPAGVEVRDLLDLAAALPAPSWIVAVIAGTDPPVLRVVSFSPEETPEDAARYASDPEQARDRMLALPRVLAEISRARHDINNPLTSAMAETQILLMDQLAEEAREGLEAVQSELRRIRDLVASTRHLRPRAP